MKQETPIEIVPNVSEGRSASAVEELASALVSGAAGGAGRAVWLLDVHRDESHHRSVLTAVAHPDAVTEAAARLLEASIRRIDLRAHQGEHPRFGALDVFPLVPLPPLSWETAIGIAERTAAELALRFEIPVFLYGRAARVPANRELPRLRRGGFEALEERLKTGAVVPDYGPTRPHPTAGACAVGVRDFLIAYNVELETSNRDVAEAIARKVRASSGGLPHVQALGFARHDRGSTQVSMNLTDFRVTSMARAFDAVKAAAEAAGVEVARSEIVGLVPEAAIFPGIEKRLRLDREPGVLEHRMRDYLIP